MSLQTSNLSDASIPESEHIAQLQRKIEELEKDNKRRVETIRDNMLQQQISFFLDLGKMVEGVSEKLKSTESGTESEMVLFKGFTEIKESLIAHNDENFHYPRVENEVLEIGENSLPDGLSIKANDNKIEVSVDYDKIENFVMKYKYAGKNIEPRSVVAIRELCKFAIKEGVKQAPRGRRERLNGIFRSRDFCEKLNSLLGNYQKFGVNEKQRILEIASTFISGKDF